MLADPDLEIQEHVGIEVALELPARGGADLAHHPPTLADEDPLLGLRLDPDLGVDLDQAVVACLDPVDLHLDRVWNLLPRSAKDLLADELGKVDLARQVEPVLRWVEEGPRWEQRCKSGDQRLQARARPGAEGKCTVAMGIAANSSINDLIGHLRRDTPHFGAYPGLLQCALIPNFEP